MRIDQSWIMKTLVISFSIFFAITLIPAFVFASDELVNCSFYKVKKDDTPAYAEPDKAAAVVYRLSAADRVCYIGEIDLFAIVDLGKDGLINKRKPVFEHEYTPEKPAFILLTDLWAVSRHRQGGSRVKDTFRYLRSGGFVDDPLGSFLGFSSGEPKCLAGELCEKLKPTKSKKKE